MLADSASHSQGKSDGQFGFGDMRPMPDAKERGAPTEAASRKATRAWAETLEAN